MKYAKFAAAALVFVSILPLSRAALAGDESAARKVTMKNTPVLQTIPDAQYKLGGELGRRVEACTENWILPVPKKNPGILDMFLDSIRDAEPFRSPEGWAGEFAGKYITHSVQIYKLTRDKKLYKHISEFVGKLVALQSDDGYLGPWPKKVRLRPGPWDTWGHYHIMVGLMLWHEQSNDAKALACASRIADMLCKKFLNTDERIVDLGACEMNMGPIHSLCLLYKQTGRKKYLDLALEIEKEFTEAGDYTRTALAGREFHQCPRPRWESLHQVMGIAELYYITGDKKYKKAFEHLWWSIVKTDRHNNGGFSTHEAAVGDPYMTGAIETCCTVAWMAMSVDMLQISGDSRVADELELSMLNSGLGLMTPDGSWVTYDTPMEGIKRPSHESIGWQGRHHTPQLNCCAVNGPRAIAMTCEWALMRNSDGLVLNYYGPGSMAAKTASGNAVSFVQKTTYPTGNKVDITVNPAQPEEFTLSLRIPYWSEKTFVRVNGRSVKATPGEYLKLNRKWTAGDRVVVKLDFRPHFWTYRPAITATHWDAKWTFFGPLRDLDKKQIAELDKQITEAKEIPKTMSYTSDDADEDDVLLEMGKEKLAPKTGVAKMGYIDLVRTVSGDHRQQFAYAFAEYNSPAAGKVRLAFSVSGAATIFVNGQKIKMKNNGRNPQYRRNRCADIQLRKGRNIIAFSIPWVRGHGWYVNAGWQRPTAPGVMRASIYRGPILMTFDPRFNAENADECALPIFAADSELKLVTDFNKSPKPMILCEIKGTDERIIRLCDFALAGTTRKSYKTWLAVKFDPKNPNLKKSYMAFSKENPLRSFRP